MVHPQSFMYLEAVLIRNLICWCCLQGCAKMMSKVGEPVPGLWNDKTWELKYIGEVCQIRWFQVILPNFNFYFSLHVMIILEKEISKRNKYLWQHSMLWLVFW